MPSGARALSGAESSVRHDFGIVIGFARNPHPLNSGAPILIDPSADDPWVHLDYDVNLGILTASYNREQGEPSEKGRATVELLRLDKRERIENQYRKNWKRLVSVANAHLQYKVIDLEGLMKELHENDDHGLLGWCISDNGVKEVPFDALWKAAPDVLNQLRENHFNVIP